LVNAYTREYKKYHKIFEGDNVLEYRLENEIITFQKILADFQAKEQKNNKELADELRDLNRLIQKMKLMYRTEKNRARRIRRDAQGMQDISMVPFVMLYQRLKGATSDTKSLVSVTDKLANKSEDLIAKYPKLNDKKKLKAVKEITTMLKTYEDDIAQELKDLILIEDSVMFIKFKLEKIQKKDIEEFLLKLINEGFPKETASVLAARIKVTKRKIYDWNVSDARAANRVLYVARAA